MYKELTFAAGWQKSLATKRQAWDSYDCLSFHLKDASRAIDNKVAVKLAGRSI
ncbi:MAG: hypothetical protein JWQ14_2676 [Adhaeribacter sp.]|nr:hypothetical protein [Adhaeribacter sp.]